MLKAAGSADKVSLLIELGADINHEDMYGWTALLEVAIDIDLLMMFLC